MNIEIICQHCGKTHEIPHWRKETAKYCSKPCSDASKLGENNTECTNCGKLFHMKKYQKERYVRTRGFYCSKECKNSDLSKKLSGELNHQFGLKGPKNASFSGFEVTSQNHRNVDIRIYDPGHPYEDKYGRVLKHRLIVEQNSHLFDSKYFENIEGRIVLKKGVDVHHKDLNHSNDEISNLEPLTRGEHTSLHNKLRKMKREELRKFSV